MKVTLSAPSGLPRASSFSRKGSFSRKRNSKKHDPVSIVAGSKPPIVTVDARDDISSSDSAASIRKTSASPETREAHQRPPRPTTKNNNNNSPPNLLPSVEPVKRKGSFSLRPPKFGRSGSFVKKAQKQKARGSQKAQAASSDESKIDAGHDDEEDLKSKWRAVKDAPDEYAVPLFDGRSSMNHGWYDHAEQQSPCRREEEGAKKDGRRSSSSSGHDNDTPGGVTSSWYSIDEAAKAIETILGVELFCK